MKKSQKALEQRLNQMEGEFRPLLLVCLEQSARGRWGLFGQNDHAVSEGIYPTWPEAKRVKELADEIRAIRLQFGESNALSERFLELHSLRGANVPGEPKLAKQMLAEMDQGLSLAQEDLAAP
jgi:hypothetical protein